ncbi:uncharacterized protein LOC142683551 [Rhinoderma darwinii]|uniref:uncharacterized protein LOC142683551 n=1 Tax=Rhinoderma darwinii TaxID=43563 RepID=UPI003F667395
MDALDFQNYVLDENQPPIDEAMHGVQGPPELCAGTVALCSLYYVHLMKERRRREFERRRRILRFRRVKARERLRFAVLWASRLLSSREMSAPNKERRIWSEMRSSSRWNAVTEKAFTNFDWIESFRMRKSTFDYVCEQLRPVVQRTDADVRRAIPTEVRLAMTLWCLGSSCEYRTIENVFGVSRSTICKVVRDVCEAVVSILTPKFVFTPKGDILHNTMKGFEQRYGLPQVAGVIGTFHVAIRPPNECAGQYFNTKGWHSVVLQAVVDSDHRFWDLNISSPGNSSNARVFLDSELYEWGTEGTLFPNITYYVDGREIPIRLLGSRSYPRLTWLVTPFPDESQPECTELNRPFSSALSLARVAFGRLKGRWRCLLKRNDPDLSFLPTLIAACCTLHNICESRGDPFEEHWLEEAAEEELEQPSECEELGPERMSEEIRDALANAVWARNGGP